MAAPLAEKGVELERTLGYFQFNRDCNDEEVRILILCKWADDPGGLLWWWVQLDFHRVLFSSAVLLCQVQRVFLTLATPFAD